MIRNYFKIIYRLLLRNKVYSFINIIGFALGLAAFILILLFVKHEIGYDKFYEDHESIYRVTRSWYDDGEVSLHLARVAPPVGPLLASDYPDLLEEVVRTLELNPIIKVGDDKFEGNRMYVAEDNFFRVFSTRMTDGDPESALTELNSIVLSEKLARQYFGDEDPMGKTLEMVDFGIFTVTGIFEDVPENTHFKYEILVSFSTLELYIGKEELMRNWGSNNYITYIKFTENSQPGQLETQLDDFIDRHYTPVVAQYLGREPENRVSEGTKLHLQKLSDIHLRSHLSTELEPNGDIRSVYIFSTVALFILLIASINFINLSTARSAIRAREVAMRKVSGASRGKLIGQFLLESMILTLIALLLAIVAVDLVLPGFRSFISRDLSFSDGGGVPTIFILVLIGLLVGFLSGVYPAFYLSKFQPIRILRSAFQPGKSSTSIRTILVITQFSISIALIISIGIMSRQLKYIQTKDTGFNRDSMLVINANGSIQENMETFKARIMEIPEIEGISSSRLIPSNDLVNSSGGNTLDGESPGPIAFRLAVVSIDYEFYENLEIEILAGRNFSRDFSTDDSTSFILNAMAVKQLGWGEPEAALNRPFEYGGVRGTVIGVVDDINFETLHNPVVPIIYLLDPTQNGQLCIRISESNRPATIEKIEEIYNEYAPNSIFFYSFLQDRYDDNYRTEFQLGKVMVFFTIFAIIIACLGLFGLSSFLAERKSKEVGICKVMGASISQVVLRLSFEFTRWVLLANLFAWPAAYFLMKRWLSNFAYHISMPWLIFILAVFVSLGIALLTVGFQAIRIAVRNPADSIKYE
jgi:putative ABC transport system permease protein